MLAMIIFHAAFDLTFFKMVNFDMRQGIWIILARFVQLTFIITTGMTMVLAFQKRNKVPEVWIRWALRHAIILMGWGMVITFITWIFFSDQAVKFGVLHFYAVASILSLSLLRLKYWNSVLGLFIILFSTFISQVPVTSEWLLPVGFLQIDFSSFDYFPLFPWFGVFLQGVAFGFWFYDQKWREFLAFGSRIPLKVRHIFEFLGRRCLLIYLIHQPLLVGILWLWRMLVN
ncbi:MAG: hypothetical protein UT36_C0008G0023 [Candidatus Peregrinibacteria bacterium GW2011_GWF2_39_17]|nr:MAG: hypothetical protein UT36_C0008G0023 [Candidatus Peregrinibacteria bacterium GW2011_GWF2_39_17]